MSHTLRTTLLLGGFWLLIFLGVGYQVHFRMLDQEKELLIEERNIREDLELKEILVSSMGAIQNELAEMETEWDSRHKIIPASETAHTTYEYLDNIVRKNRTTLNFDFLAKEKRDSSGVHFSDYVITGEARFADLYSFIWYIEQLPRYLHITSMELFETNLDEKQSTTSKRWVKFTINLSAVSADREGFSEIERVSDIQPIAASYDPFRIPQVAKQKIPRNKLGLVNVFSSTLRALTPEQAYLIDQNGALKVLNLGAKVYLGKLVDIIPDENRVIFDLYELYPPRRVPLVIKQGK